MWRLKSRQFLRLSEQFQLWLDKSKKSVFQIIWKYFIHCIFKTRIGALLRTHCTQSLKFLQVWHLLEASWFTPRLQPLTFNVAKFKLLCHFCKYRIDGALERKSFQYWFTRLGKTWQAKAKEKNKRTNTKTIHQHPHQQKQTYIHTYIQTNKH